MKKQTSVTVALIVCMLLTCLSLKIWDSKIIFIMFLYVSAVFLVLRWYIKANEVGQNFDNGENLPKP